MTDTQWEKKLKIRTARSRNHEMDGENSPYEPTPYSVLERLADSGYLSKANVLVDYGCGKGRASVFLAHKTGCRVIGIDYNQHIIEEAEANLRSSRVKNITFIHTRAEEYEVIDADSFYFFNPFTDIILRSVIARILDSCHKNPREGILSQNKNIPAIRSSVELLAGICGEKRIDSKGQEYYAFPDPEAVAGLTEKDLAECRLGYRCKYVHAAAEAVLHQKIELNYLQRADKEAAREALTGLYGVGVKVANCVSLFGLHHTDAFPIDVWMKRILKEQYPTGYPYEKYSPYNGIFQQYMFAYYRHSQTKSQ